MQATTTTLKSPPWLENAEGRPRRVGVELEMSGLKLDALAEEVAGALGLDIAARRRNLGELKFWVDVTAE